MITATRPVGCPRASMLLKTPACPVPPRRAGYAPSRPCRWTSLQVTVCPGHPDPQPPGEGRNTAKRRARAALRTGVHPVGHETGPVVYWVPGPFQVQPLPAQGWAPVASPVLDLAVT